jgi:hypothetical protein
MSPESARPLRIAIWLESPTDIEELAFMFFVLSVNSAQSSLTFCFPDSPDDLTFSDAQRRMKVGEKIYSQEFAAYIFISSEPIEGNLFFLEHGPLVIVTSMGWDRHFAPPSLFLYLLHSILCGVTYALTDGVSSHQETTDGCQYDYTRIKAHRRVNIALGRICAEHAQQIADQLGEQFLNDLQLLFSFQWLGSADDSKSVAHKLKGYFNYDLNQDHGFKKTFLERVRPNLDALWFDIGKEVFKGMLLVGTTFLLIKFGLK